MPEQLLQRGIFNDYAQAVEAWRNGLRLRYLAPPTTLDEYKADNTGPGSVGKVTRGAAPSGDKILLKYPYGSPQAALTPAFQRFPGTGAQVQFNLSNTIASSELAAGVFVYRNGLHLGYEVAPAALDTVTIDNGGPAGVGRVVFGAAPPATDEVFVFYRYGVAVEQTLPAVMAVTGDGVQTQFALPHRIPDAMIDGVRGYVNGLEMVQSVPDAGVFPNVAGEFEIDNSGYLSVVVCSVAPGATDRLVIRYRH